MSLLGRVRVRVVRRRATRGVGSGAPGRRLMPPVRLPATPPARAALPARDRRELEARAAYQRDRLGLYRARVLGAEPVSIARLRELQRVSVAADARLRHAARRDATASGER
jgi:hypothetical protein